MGDPSGHSIEGYDHFVEVVENRLKKLKRLANKPLMAVLLYTEEDRELTMYVRQHYSILDKLSGSNCDIFIIEQPSELKISTSSPHIEVTKDCFSSRRPYNKAEAIDIARQLNVFVDQLPCIAFFENLDNKDEVVVFPIEGNLTVFFRILFGYIDRQFHESFQNNRSVFDNIKEELFRFKNKTIEEQTRPTQVYNGQTLYINYVIRKSVIDMGDNNNIGDISTGNIAGGNIQSHHD